MSQQYIATTMYSTYTIYFYTWLVRPSPPRGGWLLRGCCWRILLKCIYVYIWLVLSLSHIVYSIIAIYSQCEWLLLLAAAHYSIQLKQSRLGDLANQLLLLLVSQYIMIANTITITSTAKLDYFDWDSFIATIFLLYFRFNLLQCLVSPLMKLLLREGPVSLMIFSLFVSLLRSLPLSKVTQWRPNQLNKWYQLLSLQSLTVIFTIVLDAFLVISPNLLTKL